jgi:two-component system response regulator
MNPIATMGMRARPILLVEDNAVDLDLTLQAFKTQGVTNEVVVCRDGESALRYIDSHATPQDPALPLLVLLDLHLPDLDGTDVLHHARQNEVWKQIPFVVLTSSREGTDIQTAYKKGANSYIVKPVNFLAFAKAVENIKVYWLLLNEPAFRSTVPE